MDKHICAKLDCHKVVSEKAHILNKKYNYTDDPAKMICLDCLKNLLQKALARKILSDEITSKQGAKAFATRKGATGKRTKLPEGYTTRGKVAGTLGLSNPVFKKHFLEANVFSVTEFKDKDCLSIKGIAINDVLELVEDLERSPNNIVNLQRDYVKSLSEDIDNIRMRITNGALDC